MSSESILANVRDWRFLVGKWMPDTLEVLSTEHMN